MRIFGSICAGLVGLGFYGMFVFATGSVSRYDYLAAGVLSLFYLVGFFAVFVALTWTGKLDFLGWPRPLQYGGVAVASLSLTVLMGLSAAMHGSGGREFPWSIQPFCPWAAYLIPLAVALIGILWLYSDKFAFPEYLLRVGFGIMTSVALLSNIVFGVEIRRNLQHEAEERDRTDLAIVQQTDAEKDFSRLLLYSGKSTHPPIRQPAVQKILATGPRFNPLMIECLKSPSFEDGLTYLRDNDPPGDAAPLADPARDAISRLAGRLRDEIATGRPLEADNVESRVDSIVTVAGKLSKYGVDFLPAVRDCRAALEAPKSAKVPPSSLKKMDTWLAAQSK